VFDLRWLILAYRVALIIALNALSLLMSLLLPSLFNPADPIDSFVTVTSWSTR